MGQAFVRLNMSSSSQTALANRFPDLLDLPPELALLVLSKLDATDLCLASCVWTKLANDEFLWLGLCRSHWHFCDAYDYYRALGWSAKKLYMLLDEACLTFNADHEMGYNYLISRQLVRNETQSLALFFYGTRKIRSAAKQKFFMNRPDVLQCVVDMQHYENQFLPNALRQFFREVRAPDSRDRFLHLLIDKFSSRFCQCNPQLDMDKDTVYVVCFSLIMLSVDLCSPHVKNKMSKREFIKNVLHALDINTPDQPRLQRRRLDSDSAGHFYDNVYLLGHVAADVAYRTPPSRGPLAIMARH